MLKSYQTFVISKQKICPYCLNSYIQENTINENLSGNISSLQINVPLKGCVNNCKSCIAKLHDTSDKIKMISNEIINKKKYYMSLQKVRNNCKTAVLTSDHGEPIQNVKFITQFGELNKKLNNPFNVEIQTTGVLLNDYNLSILKDINLDVVSLSIFDIFDNENNLDIIDVKKNLKYNIIDICKKVKDNGFKLRISINLIKKYESYPVEHLFKKIDVIKPDQLTFKSLWCTNEDNPINNWIKSNKTSDSYPDEISDFIINNGGNKISNNKYIYNDISIFIIKNCMLGSYLIIRNDGELYNSWLDCEPIK
jgi:pyruvate-formate lyase-activating enzyme